MINIYFALDLNRKSLRATNEYIHCSNLPKSPLISATSTLVEHLEVPNGHLHHRISVFLVHVEVGSGRILLSDLLVLTLECELHDPGAEHNTNGEADGGNHGLNVAGLGALGPQVWSVDRGEVSESVGHGNGNGFLLIGLADN